MITVFADKYLYRLASFLSQEIDLRFYDPEKGLPSSAIKTMDALLIRTITKIDEKTLNSLPDSLQFIGTGSAGTDHVNTQLLDDRGIAFADAAGCNARSVAEYVATALLIWAGKKQKQLSGTTVGIIGVGHTGSELQQLLTRLDIPVITYDPPRAQREAGFISATLDEVLSADILSFHTPLTTEGPHSTFHWMDEEKMNNRIYDLIINTARGGVVDEAALLPAHKNGKVRSMIIDVWENEPLFDDELARQALFKTPHIAGYSIQAKLRASKLIADSVIEHFGLSSPHTDIQGHMFSGKTAPIIPDSTLSISEILTSIHPILDYQQELVALLGKKPEQKASGFNKIRAEFPLRDEYTALDISGDLLEKHPRIRALFA